jgi:hypothetical protein
MMMMLFVFAGAVIYYFMNKPEEGDDCEGKDENGNYVIDGKGKCVLKSCKTGYYKSGEECLVNLSGSDCVPIGTKDPQGMYLTNQTGGCELKSCKLPYKIVGDECKRDSEVFQIKGYDYTKDQASSQCSAYGATVATRAQVDAAQVAGADWCSTGWVSDPGAAVYPINTRLESGCGNGTAGVKEYTPPDNKAAVNCFGEKPVSDDKLHPFNETKWSRYDT